MKRLFIIIASALLIGASMQAVTRRALFVAIDTYAPGTKWGDIHATNDVKLIKPELINNHGFKETNITVLQNRDATYDNIKNAMQKLKSNCKPGDIVYLHFSCHGQLMEDNTGREFDGRSETLIPFDACMEPSATYYGQNHLTDKKLASWLEELRKQLGPSGKLLVVLDACHSNGAHEVRGGNGPSVRGTDKVFVRGTSASNVPKKMGARPHATRKIKGQATQIVIYACQSNQQCGEMYRQSPKTQQNINGKLSLAVFKAIEGQRKGTFNIATIAVNTVSQSIALQKGESEKQTVGYDRIN